MSIESHHFHAIRSRLLSSVVESTHVSQRITCAALPWVYLHEYAVLSPDSAIVSHIGDPEEANLCKTAFSRLWYRPTGRAKLFGTHSHQLQLLHASHKVSLDLVTTPKCRLRRRPPLYRHSKAILSPSAVDGVQNSHKTSRIASLAALRAHGTCHPSHHRHVSTTIGRGQQPASHNPIGVRRDLNSGTISCRGSRCNPPVGSPKPTTVC